MGPMGPAGGFPACRPRPDGMDIVDRMQAREQDLLDLAIHRARTPRAPRASSGRGLCRGCQKPIPAKHLRALPGARTCIKCQRRLEGGRA